MSYIQELMAVFQRGLIVLWRNKVLLIGSLLMPFALIVFLGPAVDAQSLGGLTFEYLVSGMMCMMIFFSGMFIPNNIIWDRDTHFINIMFVSPAHRSTIILGYSLVGAVRSLIQVSIIYLGAVGISAAMGYDIYFSMGVFLALLLITILVTVFVGGFMTIIAAYSKNSETFFFFSSIIGMPIMLMSNIFFEPSSLPFGIGAIGRFNPLNHVVNTVRYLMFGDTLPGGPPYIPSIPAGTTLWEGPLVIILLAIVFTFLGTWAFVRTVKK